MWLEFDLKFQTEPILEGIYLILENVEKNVTQNFSVIKLNVIIGDIFVIEQAQIGAPLKAQAAVFNAQEYLMGKLNNLSAENTRMEYC